MIKKKYLVPTVKVAKLRYQFHLMANSAHTTLESVSRTNYSTANDGVPTTGDNAETVEDGVWKWN